MVETILQMATFLIGRKFRDVVLKKDVRQTYNYGQNFTRTATQMTPC